MSETLWFLLGLSIAFNFFMWDRTVTQADDLWNAEQEIAKLENDIEELLKDDETNPS